MTQDLIGYQALVEKALRSVAREALKLAAEHGLPGQHHFYLTFRTDHPGVVMPDYLRAKYPEEITIVLQHQFWGLDVNDERFAVTLTFNGIGERMVVPWPAVTAFIDPSVQFGLQFGADQAATPREDRARAVDPGTTDGAAPEKTGETGGAEVVTLDRFRKK